MVITLYLYKNQYDNKLKIIHCINCKRSLLRVNSDAIVLSNVGSDKLDPSAHYTEHQCHSCLQIYRILFQ
jgi:ribosomal protein L34E